MSESAVYSSGINCSVMQCSQFTSGRVGSAALKFLFVCHFHNFLDSVNLGDPYNKKYIFRLSKTQMKWRPFRNLVLTHSLFVLYFTVTQPIVSKSLMMNI